MGSMHFHCGALLFVSQWQCICSVISYSFLTVDYCSLCCARLVSQLRFVSVRGTNTLYDEPLFTSYRYCRHSQLHKICLFLQCLWFPWGQCRSIVVHCCLYTVIVHQFFWMYLYYVLLHILVELVVQFPARGSTQSVIMPFSWCVVAVTLPI